MKVLINTCYGGFGLSDKIIKEFSIDYEDYYLNRKELRTNKDLIRRFEESPEDFECSLSELKVVNIPDEATDWLIDDYDGLESVIAVIDGKLIHIA